ncbi:MAG: NAD(P)-dependent oxidoreductase [Gemmatimonadota bacterium]
MTTLLTGATGYLGAAVLERSLEYGGRNIRCLVRPGASRAHLLALQSRHGRGAIEIMEGTLTRRRDVERALVGVQLVMHLAASLRGAAADIFLNTVVGSQNLYDAIAHSAVHRLVTTSSLSVYDLCDVPTAALVKESTALDPHPERRDAYTHSKIRQEQLLGALVMRPGVACIVLRPGPLYGRGGTPLPSRIGLRFPGFLLQLGGGAPLPLSYIDNCAEAVRLAAFDTRVPPGAYNVVDDAMPTASEYLARYRREVRPLRVVRLPFAGTELLAQLNESSHRASRGQIPLLLTPYRARNMWRGHRYDTTRLIVAGWRPPVPTDEALDLAFGVWRDGQRGGSSAPAMVSR